MKNIKEQYRQALIHLKRTHGKTISWIAGKGGCSHRHIQGVLSDKEKKGIGGEAGERIASAFGLTYADMLSFGQWIIDGRDPEQWISPLRGLMASHYAKAPSTAGDITSESTNNIASGPPILQKVPVISWVRAGGWQDVNEQFHPGDADDWIHTTATNHPNTFALIVRGDSMEPLFLEGETIVVDPGREAINGSYVIARNGDNEATFKQLVVDGPNVYLRPLNTDLYKQWDMTGVEFRIIGVVVAKERRY
jgi:SOS-response transcriptional repressor LexA